MADYSTRALARRVSVCRPIDHASPAQHSIELARSRSNHGRKSDESLARDRSTDHWSGITRRRSIRLQCVDRRVWRNSDDHSIGNTDPALCDLSLSHIARFTQLWAVDGDEHTAYRRGIDRAN